MPSLFVHRNVHVYFQGQFSRSPQGREVTPSVLRSAPGRADTAAGHISTSNPCDLSPFVSCWHASLLQALPTGPAATTAQVAVQVWRLLHHSQGIQQGERHGDEKMSDNPRERAIAGSDGNADGLFMTLWRSGAIRIFPILFLYVAGLAHLTQADTLVVFKSDDITRPHPF